MDVIKQVSAIPEQRIPMVHFNISTEKLIAYPSEWFARHEGEKPGIFVMSDQQGYLDLEEFETLFCRYAR